jgi:hypothetical protein
MWITKTFIKPPFSLVIRCSVNELDRCCVGLYRLTTEAASSARVHYNNDEATQYG